ncbi:MAG TPA: S1 family peptidase [Actinomycetota bacterium]|nr:S1 family peptidase [Actinomycetota bacterium]
MTSRRALAIVAAAAALALPAVGYGGDTAASAPANCDVRSDHGLHGGDASRDEAPHERWVANDRAQRAVARISDEVDEHFPAAAKARPGETVDDGLVGIALDHHNEQVVVVVDTARVREDALQSELRAELRDAYGGQQPAFTVRVGPACVPADELAHAANVLRQRAWHPRADEVEFSYYLDPRTSTFSATFDELDRDVGDALAKELGASVVVRYGGPSRLDRLNDADPHWGGAGIGPAPSANDCTSGFSVSISTGGRGSVTAGHCYNNGQNLWSGTQYYGLTAGESGYPTWDMIRINPNGETFTNGIWVDPCCPSGRTVTGRGDPSVGTLLCVSGMVTRAKCGLEVTSTSAEFCDAAGCTPGLIRAEKPGDVVSQPGDSGGPMYTRPTTSTATIRGMIVAHTSPSNVYAEKVSSVESHLGVTVLTQQ